MSIHPLTFKELREANVNRCHAVFHPLNSWSPTDWACAVAGEVGEACNLIKKARRGEPIERVAIAMELADAVIYLDLLAERLNIDLGAAVAEKFNTVSIRRRSSFRLHEHLSTGLYGAPSIGRIVQDRDESNGDR